MYTHVHLLPTVLVKIIFNNKCIGLYRALGDTGAEPNLIRQHVIKRWLPSTKAVNFGLVGIADTPVQIKRKIELVIQPWFSENDDDKINVTFWVLPKASGWAPVYPSQSILPDAISQELSTPLANPYFWQRGEVSLLLGIEVWSTIMQGIAKKVSQNMVQQESKFGNLIYGRTGIVNTKVCAEQLHKNKPVQVVDFQQIEKTVQKFWQFEDLSLCTKKDAENELVDKMFNETYYREESGRHVVSIPIQPSISAIGSSRDVALRRFLLQEKKFDRDDVYKQKYVEFMDEMISLGHMIEAKEKPKVDELV